MKFAALALTLLLAVGSHGDVSLGEPLKGILTNIREASHRVVGALQGTDYEQRLPEIRARVDVVFDTITTFLGSPEVGKVYDSAKTRSDELATRWLQSDVRTMLIKRWTAYSELAQQFYDTHRDVFESMKVKIVEQISANHEETGTILREAAITVRDDVRAQIQSFVQYVQPYVREYMDHMSAMMTEVRESNLRDTIQPKVDDIRVKIVEIYGDILAEINKQ